MQQERIGNEVMSNLDDIEKRLTFLITEFEKMEKRQDELKKEVADLRRQVANTLRVVGHQRRPTGIGQCIANSWASSKTIFMIHVILILMVVLTVMATIIRNDSLQFLTTIIGFSAILIMMAIKYRKYRQLVVFLLIAFALMIAWNYTGDVQLKWNLMFASLSIASFGLALHGFNIGESSEMKQDEIDRKLALLITNRKSQPAGSKGSDDIG